MRHENDQPEFLHPDYEPGEFDRVERQLRHALAVEASRIQPADRLDGGAADRARGWTGQRRHPGPGGGSGPSPLPPRSP